MSDILLAPAAASHVLTRGAGLLLYRPNKREIKKGFTHRSVRFHQVNKMLVSGIGRTQAQ